MGYTGQINLQTKPPRVPGATLRSRRSSALRLAKSGETRIEPRAILGLSFLLFASPGFLLAPQTRPPSCGSKDVGWKPLLRSLRATGGILWHLVGQVGGRVGWPHPQHHRPLADRDWFRVKAHLAQISSKPTQPTQSQPETLPTAFLFQA